MNTRIRSRHILSGLGVLAGLLSPAVASAQNQGFALDKFEPTPVSDRFFAVQSFDAGSSEPVYFAGGVVLDYAHAPLVLYNDDNGKVGSKAASLVGDQMYLHIGAEIGIVQRVLVSVDFPAALVSSGTAAGGVTAPTGAAAGDLRGGLRLRLLGDNDSVFGASINGYVWFPTGKAADFTGQGTVRGSPSASIGGRAGWFFYGANLGALFQSPPIFQQTQLGPEFVFGAGVGALLLDDKLQIGPEVYGDKVVSGESTNNEATMNLEGLLGLKAHFGPVVLGAAAGPGFTRGVGTPASRLVVSLAYAPNSADRDHDGIPDSQDACPDDPGPATSDPTTNGCPDRDHDGIIDKLDACPDDPGPANDNPKWNGCPDKDKDGIPDKFDACPDDAGPKRDDEKTTGCPDTDGDGIIDKLDACPTVKGAPSDDPKKNGCPPDRDGDGIPDDVDACPDVPGVADPDPKKNGCPKDTDGDGIPDDKDACPLEPGPADPDPTKNGCPKVFIREGKIQILEQVQFKTGSDVILPASDDLLNKVSAVFKEHPEIKKVLVEGHTDNRGGKAYNEGLSKRRAASVKKWLITRGGVDAKKLDSQGFGMSRPIADNETEEGRQKNRRVEFKIVDMGTKPPDAAHSP